MWIVALIAVLFFVLAILIKHFKCYWLIAGYNTASKKEKEKVDIEGLGIFMGNMMYLLSCVMLLGVILRTLGYKLVGDLTWIVVIGITIYMVVKGQRFQSKGQEGQQQMKKSTVVTGILIFIPIILLSSGLMIYGVLPSEVVLEGGALQITGMYGTTIAEKEIISMELIDEIPEIERKVNGFDFGNILKGNFQLEEWGSGMIYLESKRGPYILIRYKDGKFVLINFKKPEDTQRTFEMLST
ncbi:DUF3784 domain-containing protein [Alkaliphilus hydrothermalis]|uniref:DUF3784 domain-containing protein n=1 Tax=Alkaliphilus hydrothermalis TaxID=1482730 RepID=A0ABS2NP02_9FIRM|nr:DUF3784 domain-containing protein [Alkaliphilus hydrothermalis]MBM7614304.1 hypothetical protein [Alkaliphilus hydrothermalis]